MPLDPEDIEQIKTMLGDSLSALPLGDLVRQQVAAAVDPLKTELATLKAAPTPDPKGKKAPDDDVDLPNPLADEVARLRQQVEAREAALADAEAKSKRDALHAAARDALVAQGVPADRVPVALAFLGDRLHTDGTQVGAKTTDRWGAETIQPMDEFIPSFLKSDQGKMFLPASQKAGTGHGSTRQITRTNGGGIDWGAMSGPALDTIMRKGLV